MTLPDTTALKALAEAAKTATPGPWKHDGVYVLSKFVGHYRNEPDGHHGRLYNVVSVPDCDPVPAWRLADAAFIAAANPQTVLALLSAVETLTADLARVTAERDEARAIADAQSAGHKLCASQSTANLLRATTFERQYRQTCQDLSGVVVRAATAEAEAAGLRRQLDAVRGELGRLSDLFEHALKTPGYGRDENSREEAEARLDAARRLTTQGGLNG